MHYYIDGYNLLFQVAERNLSFSENRYAIIEQLENFFSLHNISATLVFDSRFDLSNAFPSISDLGHLEIIYSPKGLSADDYLIEKLQILNNPTSVTVVTSDRYLRKELKAIGCSLMKIDEFLKWTLKKEKQKRHRSSFEKNIADSDHDFKRLLNIFEKKLNDHD